MLGGLATEAALSFQAYGEGCKRLKGIFCDIRDRVSWSMPFSCDFGERILEEVEH